MSEVFINVARAVSVSGHRIVESDFDKEKLKGVFLSLIERGYDTFLIGMAIGFDTLCFQILEKIREEKDIKIIACIPCKEQDKKFNQAQKAEYARLIKSADGKVLISKEYNQRCMQKRNEFLVNNSSLLVAYLNRDFGGTANTVNYAKSKNLPVIYVKEL